MNKRNNKKVNNNNTKQKHSKKNTKSISTLFSNKLPSKNSSYIYLKQKTNTKVHEEKSKKKRGDQQKSLFRYNNECLRTDPHYHIANNLALKQIKKSDHFYSKEIRRLQLSLSKKKQKIQNKNRDEQIKEWYQFVDSINTTSELSQLIKTINDGYKQCVQSHHQQSNKQRTKKNKLIIKSHPLQLSSINKENIPDYQDQFLGKKVDFSPSWREMLERDMRKFR